MKQEGRRKSALMIIMLGIGLSWFQGCSSDGAEKKRAQETGNLSPRAVETVLATASDLSEEVAIVGALAPRFEADVRSEYLGAVSEILVTQWVAVKKGAPLARLDTREAEAVHKKMQANREMARAALLEAEAALARTRREDERSRDMKEHGLITRQRLEDAETENAAAQARVTAARAQLEAAGEDLRQSETRLAKAVIRAPLDGIVSQRSVNVGDLVGEMGSQKSMFKIVDNRLLDLVAAVPSNEMGQVKIGQSLLFGTDVLPGKVFTGRVKFINPTVNQADRSVRVEAEVANRDGVLKGGLFVRGKIITGRRQGILQVPRAALVSWDTGGKKGELFVAQAGVARRRVVQTGIASADCVEIIGGLAAGEEVIIRGGFTVKDGDRVKIVRNGGGA